MKVKILVIGLTSTRVGGMESHNLGNYIIIEPFFSILRETFPDAEISTTIQMSDKFYDAFGIRGLRARRFWTYGKNAGFETACDAFCIFLWKITRRKLFLKSLLLAELSAADLVIDFSGDIYGDNAEWTKFLEGNARLFFSLLLRKKVVMLAGSPGPFKSIWRQVIAKYILTRLHLVANREPLSTAMLAYIGIKDGHIVTAACPSVCFNKVELGAWLHPEDRNKLVNSDRPVVGFILCGWNMPVGPYHKWPREDFEFETFVKILDYLILSTDYRVCVMSHQNATGDDGELAKGGDHILIDRLLGILGDRYDGDRIYSLKGLYDAAQSKSVIGCFEFLISGRIHGAVQALSQTIPAIIMDYGHDPKPHKLAGFARVYGIDDYFVPPDDPEAIIRAIESIMKNQWSIRAELDNRLPMIKSVARSSFDMLPDLVGKSPL